MGISSISHVLLAVPRRRKDGADASQRYLGAFIIRIQGSAFQIARFRAGLNAKRVGLGIRGLGL